MMFVEIDSEYVGKAKAVTSNISHGGMAVICDADLDPGDEASVRVGGHQPMSARVVWRSGRRIGLRFDEDVNLVRQFGAAISPLRLKSIEKKVPADEESD